MIDSRCGKYSLNGYCATCFKHLFPEDLRSKKTREKSKELRVRNEIDKYFDGFIHDTTLWTGNCNHRRRIDHRILIK